MKARWILWLLAAAWTPTAGGQDYFCRSPVIIFQEYLLVPAAAVPCLPPMVAGRTPLARQEPAPPSSAPARPEPSSPAPAVPPAARPEVIESRSPSMTLSPEQAPIDQRSSRYFDAYYVEPAGDATPAAAAAEPCSVSFWNLAAERVKLRVNNQVWMLTRDRPLSVRLPRQFVWQVEDREPEAVQIAAGKEALEIVIRR